MTHNYLLEFYGALVNRLPTRSCSAGRFATYVFLVLVSLHGQAQNYTVNTTADGTSSSGTVNLRGAILAADAIGGNHTITVPAGVYTLTMGMIAFGNRAQNITITGAGPTSTTINMGTGANQDRFFLINPPGTNSNIQTTITGIRFTNGHLKSDDFGGGALIAGGPDNALTLTNCVFENNTIDVSKTSPGGAISFIGGGSLSIDQCVFTGNSAPSNANVNGSGGAVNFQAYGYSNNNVYTYPNNSLSITNSRFTNNSSGLNGQGGAINVSAGGFSTVDPPRPTLSITITKNSFTNNSAPGAGASIANARGGAIAATNSFSPSSVFFINYNRFVGNTAGSGNGSALATFDTQGSVDATNNWWGCNGGPSTCNDKAYRFPGSSSGTLTATPYLQLRTTSLPASLCGGAASTITSSFTLNSNSQTIATSNLSAFTGVPISFSAVLGTISNAQTTIQSNGLATATYTAGATPGTGTVNALVDNVPNTDVTARASITISAAPTISTPPAPVIACVGSTASFSAVASGSGTLSFQWYKGNTLLSNGPTGTGSTIAITSTATTSRLTINSVSPADAATNYSVRVSSSTGSCTTNSTNAALTVNNPPPATLSNNGPLSCNATSVTLTASGGSTYQFSTGATQVGNGPTATVSTTGVYSVTVVGASGCSAIASTTVTDSGGSLIAFSGQPSSASTVNVGAVVTTSVSITSTGQGTGPITYQWYKNNLSSPVTGQTSATLTLNNVQLSDAGSYSVVAVGTCNSLTSTAFNLTVNPNAVPLSLSLTASPTTILTTGTTTLSATVSGGSTPYSYVFTGPGTITQTPTSNTASVSGLSAGVQTFTVVVTDATSPTSQTIAGTVSVTVSQANTPPVATANANQTATVGVPFSYTVAAFTDLETPSGLTYSATIDPVNNFMFNPATRIISGTPSMSGVSSVTVVATDPGSLSASTSFTITVSPAPVVVTPLALTFTASPTMILTTGTTTLSVTVSGGSTPYSYVFTGPGIITQTSTSNTASVSGLSAGVQTFTVVVTDATSPTSQTSTGTVSVTVSEPAPTNTPPTTTGIANQTATVNQAFSLNVASSFSDTETPNSLSFSATGLPAGLSLSGSTISGTLSASGVSSVTVVATDPGSLSVSTSFTITVSPAPVVVTPLALTFTASPTTFLTTGSTTLSATVSGGSTPYSYVFTGPGTISQTPANNTASVSGLSAGVQTFTVLVTDATSPTSQTSTGTVSVTVSEPAPTNTPPTTTGIANQTATVNQAFSLNVASSFSDTETPNSLSFSATGLPAGLSLSGSTISGTPSMSGVSSVTVRATDPGSLSVSTSFTFTVSPAVVTPTAPFSITGVTTLDCTPVANRINVNFNPRYAGLNGQPISFSVVNELSPTTAPGPYTLQLYADNPTITLKATQSGTAGEATFSYNWLAACNSLSMVTPNNTAPTTTGIANQSGTVNQGFSLNVASSFSDAETPNNLSYSATGLPAGLSLSGSTISGTPSASGVSTVTVRATDPGSLSVATSFTFTVSPAASMTSTGAFSITGVTTLDCTPVANRININFNPRYAGLNGQPINFQVANELSPTTAPGPYSLSLYADNPVILLKATQSGTAGEASFSYNWLAACNSLSMVTPNNTPPTTTGIANQSGTVNQGFSLNVASSFSDAETPNNLSFSATGLPAGLSLSGSTISGTPSASGVSSVTVRATDPGSLSVATSFTFTVSPAASTPPTGIFAITGVTTLSCQPVGNQINLTFNPQYAGANGQPISFSVVNELSPTTAPGPYTLRLYTDNPTITLKATQQGTAGEVSFAYNWLAACSNGSGARLGAEPVAELRVRVLGNPVVGETVDVEVRGAAGQSLRLETLSEQGYRIDQRGVEQAGSVERFTVRIGASAGVYLLRATTPTQSQTVKLLKK